MTRYVLDLETTTKTSFKRKANPFDPANFIVCVGYREVGAADSTFYSYSKTGEHQSNWFADLLSKARILIGHNIKFDLLHIFRARPENYRLWQKWIVNGGRVWDTQLAEYLLQGMQQKWHMNSLNSCAVLYGGTAKISEVAVLWESGVDTPDIDPTLLHDYLVGTDEDNLGDLGNTELVFLGQTKRAKEAKQLASIWLNMAGNLATIDIENNGLFADVGHAEELEAELRAEVQELHAGLSNLVPDNLPFEFNWTSLDHKSALIFGGSIKYLSWEYTLASGTSMMEAEVLAKQLPSDAFQYRTKEETHAVLLDGSSAPMPADGEDLSRFERIKSGKKKGELKTKKVKVPDFERPVRRRADAYYTFPGVTSPAKKWASDKPGFYSVASEVMDVLATRNIPLINALQQYAKKSKDLTTYFHSEDKSKGMLTLVGFDNIIHHSLNMCSTVTARLSSSSPNLQNLPRKANSRIKEVFASRYCGGKIITSDFSSLEIYMQALLTRCSQLVDDLKAKLDLHCVRVSQKEHIPYEEALRRCKVEPEPEWEEKRTSAKIFSFQRAYGAGVATIAAETGLPEEEIEKLVQADMERYPELETFFTEEMTPAIESNAIATQTYYPHPDYPQLIVQMKTSEYRTPDGKAYSFTTQPAPGYLVKRGTNVSFSPTQIKNYPVQGLGAEFAKAAMFLCMWLIYRFEDKLAGRMKLINQVHDANYADSAPEIAVTAAALIHAGMEMANVMIEKIFNWPIEVPVPAETSLGPNMAKQEVVTGDEFSVLVRKFKSVIRKELFDGYTATFEKENSNG